jgi:1,4-dihydroxy-2-naphthoate octaprenyltransferase
MGGRIAEGVWRLVDPRVTLASAASLFLGTAAAAADGPLAPGWLAITVLGVFALEAAKNASGEIVDFDSGTDAAIAPEDRSPFSGGKRVLVEGLLTRRQTAAVAWVGYLTAAVAGTWIALGREPRVVPLGVAGAALAYFYHGAPLRLSYRGFGEVAVALAYGPLVACGAYVVQRSTIPLGVLLASLPLGLLVAAFLWINEFPDYRADAAAGKRNAVVRLGRSRAARAYAALVALAYAGLLALPLAGLPATLWLGLAGAPLSYAAARRILADPETTSRIVPAQGWTLGAFVVYAAGVGVGFLLDQR